MKNIYDITIIGGGVIGISICDELTARGYKVLVVEKNPRLAQETSEGNSGVVHGGFDASSHKLNARLNVEGRKIFENKWFKELDFPWEKVDSLVIALNQEEKNALQELYNRGITNGLTTEEMKLIDGQEVLKLEPNVNPKVLGALLCTASYALDPVALTYSLWKRAENKGAKLLLNHKVVDIKELNNEFEVICQTNEGTNKFFNSKYVINCAGHYSDDIAALLDSKDFTLKTRRGQYSILEKTESKMLNNHIIFLVPTIYGKGVIVAPTLDGHVLVGPTAVENVAKEDTRLVTIDEVEKIATLGKKIMPNLNMKKVCKIISGSRPISVETDDFIIKPSSKNKNFIIVSGIKSPGLSAAPAIALEVANMIK